MREDYDGYRDEYDGGSIMLAETMPKARKEHGCTYCSNTIKVGERYRRQVGIVEHAMAWTKTCQDCLATERGDYA